jgi:hypothetical protein
MMAAMLPMYRVMARADDGRPLCGARASQLGVRPGVDVQVQADDLVHPGTGGLSVTPDPARLPPFLRPPSHGGHGGLPLFEFTGHLPKGLAFRPDPKKPGEHGFVEPDSRMVLGEYQAVLCSTRGHWETR